MTLLYKIRKKLSGDKKNRIRKRRKDEKRTFIKIKKKHLYVNVVCNPYSVPKYAYRYNIKLHHSLYIVVFTELT